MDVEAELLKVMSKDELEQAVKAKTDEFHGFLTREVALKLVAADKEILKKEIKGIKDIHTGARGVSVLAAVTEVYPMRIYPSGNRSRIIRIKDDTGETGLMLWNKDADDAAGVKVGDEIEVINAMEKNGELSLGYSGYMKIVKSAGFTPLNEVKEFEGKRIHVRSFISNLIGHSGSGYQFSVSDGKETVECFMGYKDARYSGLANGREIVLENALVDKGNIKIDDKTRVLLKKEKIITGILESIEEKDDKVEVIVDRKKYLLEKDAAYRFLDVKAVEGVELSTIIKLKRDSILNKNVLIDLKGVVNVNNVKSS